MHIFTKPDPTIAEFREYLDRIAAETSSDGGKTLASHQIHTTVTVSSIDPDDNASYELVGIDVDHLFGCGCWVGPRLIIRRVPDEAEQTGDGNDPTGTLRKDPESGR